MTSGGREPETNVANAAARESRVEAALPPADEVGHETQGDATEATLPQRRQRSHRSRLTSAYAAVEEKLSAPAIRRRLEIGAPIAIVTLAAVLRLVGLGSPGQFVFDETYYVKDGYSTWKLGYEGEWAEGSDERFEAGDASGLTAKPDYVVHPPLGKWIIGAAMAVFGIADPAMWRLSSAIFGVVLVALTYVLARGLTRSLAFASLAGFWMAIDGFAIVMSRTALLDGVLATFVLAGAGALLLDRQGSAARTIRALAARPQRIGAALWSRPWIVVAGVLLGAACATKWSGIAFLGVFGLWTVALDALDRRRAGFKRPWIGTLITQAPASFVLLMVPALIVYVASYGGWFGGGWGSQLLVDKPDLRWTGLFAWVPSGLQALWDYHRQQLGFHVGLSTEHPYSSRAIEWLWLGKPTAFESGTVDGIEWWITAIPNVVLWYGGMVAVGFLLFHLGSTLDRRAGFLLAGIVAGYVPWLLFPERTIFFFYAIVFYPFVIIGLVMALQRLVAAAGSSPGLGGFGWMRATAVRDDTRAGRRRRAKAWVAILVVIVASLFVFVWYLPVVYGIPVTAGG